MATPNRETDQDTPRPCSHDHPW